VLQLLAEVVPWPVRTPRLLPHGERRGEGEEQQVEERSRPWTWCCVRAQHGSRVAPWRQRRGRTVAAMAALGAGKVGRGDAVAAGVRSR